MAGLFGLFNFEKEGPGIAKDAPKKKTFIVFFETFFRNFWKFITLNIVYSLFCLPIILSMILILWKIKQLLNLQRIIFILSIT